MEAAATVLIHAGWTRADDHRPSTDADGTPRLCLADPASPTRAYLGPKWATFYQKVGTGDGSVRNLTTIPVGDLDRIGNVGRGIR